VGFDPLDGTVAPPDGETGLDGAGLDGAAPDGGDASFDGSVPVDGMVPDGGGAIGTWAHGFTGPSFEFGGPVAVDGAGNSYSSIVGSDEIDLGGMPVTFELSDVFVASYDTGGTFRWLAALGGTGWDQAQALFFDTPRDRLVIGGYFSDTVDFGDGTPRTSAGLRDALVLTLSPTGSSPSVRIFGGAGSQEVRSVAVAADGSMVIGGTFERSVDFGGGPLASNGMADGFVAAFDSTGAHAFSRNFGSNMGDQVNAVAIDDAGNVYIAGQFLRDIDLGGGTRSSAGLEDGFIASYTASGTHRWSYVFGGTERDTARSIAVAPDGTCFLTGGLGSADLGEIPLPLSGSGGFIASFSGAGAYRWSMDVHNAAFVVWDSGRDDIQVGGSFSGSIDVGGGTLTSNGSSDILLVELRRDGTHVRSRSFGGAGSETMAGLAVNPAGTIAISGSLIGTWTFAGTTMVGDMYGDPFLIEVPR
jgi:hypothetical protein